VPSRSTPTIRSRRGPAQSRDADRKKEIATDEQPLVPAITATQAALSRCDEAERASGRLERIRRFRRDHRPCLGEGDCVQSDGSVVTWLIFAGATAAGVPVLTGLTAREATRKRLLYQLTLANPSEKMVRTG
jgi:hypothetical protein